METSAIFYKMYQLFTKIHIILVTFYDFIICFNENEAKVDFMERQDTYLDKKREDKRSKTFHD